MQSLTVISIENTYRSIIISQFMLSEYKGFQTRVRLLRSKEGGRSNVHHKAKSQLPVYSKKACPSHDPHVTVCRGT